MTWADAVVTDQGMSFKPQVLEGKGIYLDYSTGGTGTVPALSLTDQTALVNYKQNLAIVAVTDVDNGKKINIQITNQGLAAGYTLQQIGIWAHIDSGAPVLFAILQDDTGIPIPAESELTDFSLNFYAILDFSNEAEFYITIDPAALVSMATMTALLAALELALPIVSDTEPPNQPVGALWFDTSGGPLDPSSGGEPVMIVGNVYVGPTPPENTDLLWYDTSES